MTYTILAADDEIEMLDALELYMTKEGFSFIKALDGMEAAAVFQKQTVHLLLLDIMMPKLDGFAVLKKIRETSAVPAIMVSARDADYDKILGLELSADDYITKPYNPLEVVARVKALLRRYYDYAPAEIEAAQTVLTHKNLVLHVDEGVLLKEGQEITLTSTEFKMLKLFMAHPGRIFTRQQIYEAVWEEAYYGDDNTVSVHLSNLRNKIENNPKKPAILKTIKGLGYKMEK